MRREKSLWVTKEGMLDTLSVAWGTTRSFTPGPAPGGPPIIAARRGGECGFCGGACGGGGGGEVIGAPQRVDRAHRAQGVGLEGAGGRAGELEGGWARPPRRSQLAGRGGAASTHPGTYKHL